VGPRASLNVLPLLEFKPQFLGCPFYSLVTVLTVISQIVYGLMA